MAITPEYQAYLNSAKWKAKRYKVLRRASFRCEKCGKRQATQIHHLTYRRIFNEPLTDLLAVCAKCHMRIHGIKNKWRKRWRLGRILAKVIR